MKAGTRVILLRILATVAVNACVYAATVTLRATLFRTDGGLVSLVLFASAMILAYAAVAIFVRNTPGFINGLPDTRPAKFLAFMLKIDDAAEFISLTIAWLIMLLPVLFTFLTYNREGALRVLFELLPVILAYIITLKNTRLSASQIMSNTTVYTSFGVLIVCLELPFIFDRLFFLRPWLFAIALFFIFAYLIVKNQEDIDDNIYSKKHIEKSILPKNLRSFNALTVCVIFLIILLLFNFKKVVVAVIGLLTDFVALVIKWLMLIMGRLISEQEPLPQGGAAGAFELPEMASQPGSAVVNLIFNVLSRFVVLYLAYRLLLLIVRKIPVLYNKIAGLIRKLFSIQKEKAAVEESDFIDVTETVRPVYEGIMKKAPRKIRRSRSNLKRVKDPVQRVRLMYSIILSMLPMIGSNPDKYDTTMEIINKVSSDDVLEELYPFTQVYNKVRYREERPDDKTLADAQARFDKVLEVIERT